MSSVVLYGIKNCDTVQKARTWLDRHGIEYRFHDFRSEGLDSAQAARWIDELGLDAVINKRGMTWRALDAAVREGLTPATAPDLLAQRPALVKRPVLDIGHQRVIGFNEQVWQDIFKQHTL